VMAINCSLRDAADLHWWQPTPVAGAAAAEAEAGSPQQPASKPWLPWAVEVSVASDTWEVRPMLREEPKRRP
jgi:hypothetical protein